MAILRRALGELKVFGKTYILTLSNLVGSAVFFTTGSLILILASRGSLSGENMEVFTKTIQNSAEWVNSLVGNNLPLNIIFFFAVIIFLYKIAKKL